LGKIAEYKNQCIIRLSSFLAAVISLNTFDVYIQSPHLCRAVDKVGNGFSVQDGIGRFIAKFDFKLIGQVATRPEIFNIRGLIRSWDLLAD
jgi:uncharacterized membrane protein YkgB